MDLLDFSRNINKRSKFLSSPLLKQELGAEALPAPVGGVEVGGCDHGGVGGETGDCGCH